MSLKKIIELVRREDVVLWIGAGFSLYAGYPSGKTLAENLYETLTAEEKDEISKDLPLAELSEQVVRIKGGSRNSLNVFLRNELSKAPTIETYHKLLSKIPHIKTIVTTNYDRLFERAYQDDIFPIVTSQDMAYRDGRVELYKIHGDLNNYDSIIVTRSDYNKFYFQDIKNSLIWSALKERLSNRTVVFIGYDFEDGNIMNLFQAISDELGTNKKEMFLVAPGLKRIKVDHLTRLGIQYLDFKGEPFVKKLYENVKEKITSDFEKGHVSADTIRKFYEKNGLKLSLESQKSRYAIKSVGFDGKPGMGKLHLELADDIDVKSKFKKFVKGEEFGELKLNGEQLKSIRLVLNEINVMGDDPENVQVKIQSIPNYDGKVAIVFDDGFEIDEVKIKIYNSSIISEIRCTIFDCVYVITIPKTTLVSGKELTANFTFNLGKSHKTVNEAIIITKINLNLAKGVPFRIFPDAGKAGANLDFVKLDLSIEHLERDLKFYEDLKKVERLHNIRFTNITDYTWDDFINVDKIIDFSEERRRTLDWDGSLTLSLAKDNAKEFSERLNKSANVVRTNCERESLTVFGHNFTLGFETIHISNPYIVNLEELLNGTTKKAIVKSRIGKIEVYYAKDLIGDDQNITDE